MLFPAPRLPSCSSCMPILAAGFYDESRPQRSRRLFSRGRNDIFCDDVRPLAVSHAGLL